MLRVDLPDGRIIEYDNDPLGRRIAKKINGVIVEKYLWQGLTRLLAVYDGSDNLLMRLEYAEARVPVAIMKEGLKYHLFYDQVGSLRAVADSVGNVVKRIHYDSFGNIVGDSDLSFIVPLGFAGGLHDQDTGLVRFGYRDYDPEVGRWTAKDHIFFAGGDTDLYGYVLNDPINKLDPTGEAGMIGSGIVAVSGAIGGYITGGWKGALIGAGVGGVVGFFAPQASYTAGSMTTSALLNGIANFAGQVVGALVEDTPCDITKAEYFREELTHIQLEDQQ